MRNVRSDTATAVLVFRRVHASRAGACDEQHASSMKWVALILIAVGGSLLVVSLTTNVRPGGWERGDDEAALLPLALLIGVILLLAGLTLLAVSVFIAI
jgi:uncharacterized membrane protein YqjE